MSPKEAQRAARIELGGIEQVKEQVREERIGNWLHSGCLGRFQPAFSYGEVPFCPHTSSTMFGILAASIGPAAERRCCAGMGYDTSSPEWVLHSNLRLSLIRTTGVGSFDRVGLPVLL